LTVNAPARICLGTVLVVVSAVTNAHDYPTFERVLFVEACAREHPERARHEMIYKCSCALDAIADEIPYDQFVEVSTAFYAGQVAGKRGTSVRESDEGRKDIARFREARTKAYGKCLIN
jgi:hypothetical protein